MAGAGGYFYGPDPAQLAAFRAGAHPSAIYDGKRNRKPVQRRTVDYSSTLVRYLQARTHQRTVYDQRALQPTPESTLDILPPRCYQHLPGGCFASKFVHQSMNKMRCSINVVQWTPEGRRLITGTMSGEFTLWNGQSFNFETILQAHDTAVRAMCWSHNDNWMVTGDDGGCIKYWQTNMNNVKANPSAHKEAVRGLSFCPTDLKYCSCSDDTSLKIWDFGRCEVDMNLTGHGWDVKCVDWHPTKALVVSGGKDNLIKFWDPASGSSINTLHGHKNTVMSVKWNQNGNWVLSASRDMLVKVYDIRTMREMATYRGHHREVTAIAWHPVQEEVFVSGSYDGAIYHWHMSFPTPQVEVTGAHESSVWSLAFHPLGHILCSGSNDHMTKFWVRQRPDDRAVPPPIGRETYGQQYGGNEVDNEPMEEVKEQMEEPTSTWDANGTIPGVGPAVLGTGDFDGLDYGQTTGWLPGFSER
eukprot:jgi/Mesvir1/27298/Mv07130-RA.1